MPLPPAPRNVNILAGPRDALRGFTPAPFRARFRLGANRVMVHTNDFALLPALPLETDPVELDAPIFEWKVVRDDEASGLLEELHRQNPEPVAAAEMGPACLLSVDHQRRELLCVIGAEVDARVFQEVLLPFFCRLMNDAADPAALGDPAGKREGAASA